MAVVADSEKAGTQKALHQHIQAYGMWTHWWAHTYGTGGSCCISWEGGTAFAFDQTPNHRAQHTKYRRGGKKQKKYLSVWVASRLFSYSRGLKKKSIAESTRAVFPQCRRRNGSLHNIHKTILCFLKTKCHDSNNNKELCSHGSFCAKMQLNVLRQSKTVAENID